MTSVVMSGLKSQLGLHAYLEVSIITVIVQKLGEFYVMFASQQENQNIKKKNVIYEVAMGQLEG